ncbi:hypothetical protein FGO68_gene16051 [Halteria grandinella]|uniref:Uncharacterized protein n=1 Tax=Halteria grandinella TaxID=5974 RepID=A0A8J8NQ00_HALGN|nr:hypothetical protein FGO68_gene16051 [Halteria grandinella]
MSHLKLFTLISLLGLGKLTTNELQLQQSADGLLTLWLDHSSGISSDFLIGSANKTVNLLPFVNLDLILIAAKNCSNINGFQEYDPAQSDWWSFSNDKWNSQLEVSPFSRMPQYFRGSMIRDSFCPKNGTKECVTNETEKHTTFFLVTEVNGTLNIGNNDGILGLAPSQREGFKSYLDILKEQGRIIRKSFSYKYDKDTPRMVFGDFDEESRSVSFEKLPTRDGDLIYGAKILHYEFNGVEIDFGTNSYFTFEPSISYNLFLIRDQQVFNATITKLNETLQSMNEHSMLLGDGEALVPFFKGMTCKDAQLYTSTFKIDLRGIILEPNLFAISNDVFNNCIMRMGFVYNPNLTEGVDNLYIMTGETLGDTVLSINFDSEELVLAGGYAKKGAIIRLWGWIAIISGIFLLIAIIGFVVHKVRQGKLSRRLDQYETIQQ